MEPALFVLVPLMVAAVAGGLVAGEARSGVLRTWLCRPVSRLCVITAKQLAAWVHAISLTAFLGLFALALGHIFFGAGDLVDFRSGGGLVILEPRVGLLRLVYAYGLAAVVMCAMASIALLCSVIFQNPLTASAVAVAFLITCGIISALEYFHFLRPYLLSAHLDFWTGCFKGAIDTSEFVAPLSCVLGYCLVPYMVSALIFWRKDVTC